MALNWRQRRANSDARFFCSCGCGDKPTYQLIVRDDGTHDLKLTGETDLYATIQSYRENCDMSVLLKSFDPLSLANAVSTYSVDDVLNSNIIDYSTMPDTLGGMFNLVRQADNIFNGLPADFRAEFNNSTKVFASKFNTAEFREILSKYVTPKSDSYSPYSDVIDVIDDSEGDFSDDSSLDLDVPKSKKTTRGRGRPKKGGNSNA